MIQFREGVTPYAQLNEGTFVKGKFMRVSPKLQAQLREKYPDLKNIQKEFVLKEYCLSERNIHYLFNDKKFDALPIESRAEDMARILKKRQEFVADYFHDVLPNLVARSLFIPIIDKRDGLDQFKLYELQKRVDTSFSVSDFPYAIMSEEQIRKRMQSELLAFCKKAKVMHLQNQNPEYKGQFLDIQGDNLFFTRDGELQLVDTNILFNASDHVALNFFLKRLSIFEQRAEKL